MGRAIEEEDGDEGQKGHDGGEVVDVDVGMGADSFAQGVDDRLAGERAQVDYHVEDGVTAGAGLGGGLLGNGGGDDRLDEGAAYHDDRQCRDDEPPLATLGKAGEADRIAILHQSGRLEQGRQDAYCRIADGEQREGQQHGAAESDLVGVCAGEQGQQIESARKEAGYYAGFEIVESKDVGQIDGEDDEDAVVGHAFKHLGHIGCPEGATERLLVGRW